MRGVRSLAAFAAATLIGVAYAQVEPQGKPATASISDIVAYAAYQSDVSNLASMRVESAEDVETAIDLAARHERDALVRGWMSYAADVAAQSPAFVAGVRAAERRWGAGIASRFTSNRAYARSLPGADDAIQLALNALAADASRVAAVAERHRTLAYSLQRREWGRAVSDRLDERLQRVRTLGRPGGYTAAIPISTAAQLTPRAGGADGDDSRFGGRRFWDALHDTQSTPESEPTPQAWRANETRREALDAILSVAALRVLGAQEAEANAISFFLRDPQAVGCVDMARLQFNQCLSATRFVYEGEFCLAQHALRDTAMCMTAPIARDAAYAAAFAAPQAPADLPEPEAAAVAPEAVADESEQEPALLGSAEVPTPAIAAATPPLPEVAPVAAQAAAAAPNAEPNLASRLASMGAGELYAQADELDEQGQAAQARMVRRSLISRFPDSPLALLAAQRLAGAPSDRR